jgi:hypothetical protein
MVFFAYCPVSFSYSLLGEAIMLRNTFFSIATLRRIRRAACVLVAFFSLVWSAQATDLYVTYSGNVRRFDPSGTQLSPFATGLPGPGQLAFNSNGDLFVVCTDNLIHRFGPTGTNLGTFGTAGFTGLNDVVIDAAGNIYVDGSLSGTPTIRKFGPTGSDLGTFASVDLSGGMAIDTAGNVYVAYGIQAKIHKFGPAGNDLGTFVTFSFPGAPTALVNLAFDSSGNLYASDPALARIEKFGPTGSTLGSVGSGLSTLIDDIVVDSGGNLYVGDHFNALAPTIQKFGPTGTSLGAFHTFSLSEGSPGNIFMTFAPVPEPSGIALIAIAVAGLSIAFRREPKEPLGSA